MLKHNLLTIFRSFQKSKSTFVINLIGLSSSLAVALLIYLWVSDELMFDKFYPDHDRIFQVMEHKLDNGTVNTSGNTPDFLAETLGRELPEVEFAAVATPAHFFPAFTISDGNHHVKATGKFADKDFLMIFNHPLVQGSPRDALEDKNSILISESLARNIFGKVPSCIGKSLEWKVMGSSRNVTVTGVFRDLPANTSERFEFLVTFDSFRELMGMQKGNANWDNSAPFVTYVKIKENTNVDALDKKVRSFLAAKTRNSQNRTLFITRYSDTYLHGQFENGQQTGGRIDYVIFFGCIAFFIVLIACINFTNLATAKAITKAKASGIRKAIGAQRKSLMLLYFTEAMVITLLSMFIALVATNALLPQFNSITGKNLELVFDKLLVSGLVVIFVLTSLLAGGYPAFYLSGFNPARVLKGQFNVSRSGLFARKGLVVFQFVMSIAFIAGVIIVYEQIQFISTKNLGYNKNEVIYFEADGAVAEKVESFLSEVKNVQGVISVSGMLGNVVSSDGVVNDAEVRWGDKVVAWNHWLINYDLLELLHVQIKEGRSFSRDFRGDLDKIILNEAAVDALGMDDPIGKVIGGKEIVGVVKNFHYQSLREIVRPLAFSLEPQATTTIMIRYQPGDKQETIDRLKNFYSKFNPGYVFNYNYLDSDYRAQYASESKVGMLSGYAAGLTIIISCLGLFGLVSFTTETRSKEISIRKILGSGEINIILLLSNDFMKTVLIAVLVATPVSYFLSRQWLDSFAFKIDLSAWYFIIAPVSTLLIASLTVSFQAWKAARMNPARNLRSE